MSYEHLRHRIASLKVNGVEVPLNIPVNMKTSLDIMFNLDMVEKNLAKSNLAEAKTVLDKIRSLK